MPERSRLRKPERPPAQHTAGEHDEAASDQELDAVRAAFALRDRSAGARGGLTSSHVVAVQRKLGNAAVARLRAEGGDGASPVRDLLAGGGGSPLDKTLESKMEAAFDHDFSKVRVHRGQDASDSARSVGAAAYTVGSDVVLGGDHPSLQSAAGQHTLAHELAHVVQQKRGPVDASPAEGGISVSSPSDRFEVEAERAAKNVSSGAPAGLTAAPAHAGAEHQVQRWPFGKKDPAKEEEKKRKEEEKKQAKAQHKANKKAESGVTKRQKEERKVNNALREQMAQRVSGGTDKNDGTKMKDLANQAEAKMKEEAARVEALIARGIPEDNAREQAYTDVWGTATPELRALRPMRETSAEHLQRDIDEFRNDYKVQTSMEDTDKKTAKRGGLLPTEVEELYERQEARIQELVAAGTERDVAEKKAVPEIWNSAKPKILAERPPLGSKLDKAACEDARKRLAATKRLGQPAKKTKGEKVAEGMEKGESVTSPLTTGVGYVSTAMTVSTKLGFGTKLVTLTGKTSASTVFGDSSSFMTNLSAMLTEVTALFNSVNTLVKLVGEFKAGERQKIDIHVISQSVNAAVGNVNGAANMLKSILTTCGQFSADLASVAAEFAPGLGIAISLNNSIKLAFQLASTATRLGQANSTLYSARARGIDPMKIDALVNPLLKLQSAFTKRVETVSFNLSTTLVKLSSGIVEVIAAAAHGAGVVYDKAVKVGVVVLNAAHSFAHLVADDVITWQGQVAQEAYVGREEGSAEQLQRTNATFAIDALIVRARKGDDVALAYLRTYNLTDEQILKWPGAKLHQRIMGDAGLEEDPQTTFQKFKSGFNSVKETIGSVGEKGKDVRALREARNAQDGKDRGIGWEAKMFLKSIFRPGKFERSKRKTEVNTGKALREAPKGPQMTISGPTLTGGSFSNIVSIVGGVVLTKTSDEATKAKWSQAVAKMTLEELQGAAKAPYHDDEMKAFFANWVEMRLHEQSMRAKKKPVGVK